MNIIRHFLKGLKNCLASWRLGIVLFVFKFACALFLVIPLNALLSENLEHDYYVGDLLTRLDLTLIIDFVQSNIESLKTYLVFFLLALLVVIVLHIFISGAIFRLLCDGLRRGYYPFTIGHFFRLSGRYLFRFARLFLYSLLFYLVVIAFHLLFAEVSKLVFAGLPAWFRFIWIFVRLAITGFLVMLVVMTFDYARIHVVTVRHIKVRMTVKEAFIFVGRNFGGAVSLYLLLAAGLIVMVGIFWGLKQFWNLLGTSTIVLVAAFIFEQTLCILRSFYRLLIFSSQISFFDANREVLPRFRKEEESKEEESIEST
jgi:hypothetical protein